MICHEKSTENVLPDPVLCTHSTFSTPFVELIQCLCRFMDRPVFNKNIAMTASIFINCQCQIRDRPLCIHAHIHIFLLIEQWKQRCYRQKSVKKCRPLTKVKPYENTVATVL